MVEYLRDTAAIFSLKLQFIVAFFIAITLLQIAVTRRVRANWSPRLRESGLLNVIFVAFNTVTIMIPVLAVAVTATGLQQVPYLAPFVWDDMPWIVRALAALLVFDLTNYAIHRWMHSNAWLWPLHAVHHSDTDLHFLSTNRAHILEWAVLFPAGTISAFLFGLSINDVLYLSLLRELHQYYVHSKLDWSHGPFRYVLVSPQYHRWHHVDRPEAYNKNFAFIFPFIDLIFGTYRFPGSPKDLPTGFDGNPGNQFIELLAFPFAEWRRLLNERFTKSQNSEQRSEAAS